MRRAAKIDANHNDVVKALRSIGATVHSLAREGGGCPDLLVGYRGTTLLMEVKDGSRPPSERRLNPDQEKWIEAWRGGAVWLITSVQEAIDAATLTAGIKIEVKTEEA